MISNLKPHKLIYRDGTSQQDRHLEALNPDYVQIEGRSIEDLIMYAQQLAKELNFFDQDNKITSNWEAFLIDDIQAYRQKTETGKEIQRKQWVKQLVAYAENPDRFQNDSDKMAKLSRPQLVLFLTFLKLLDHLKTQINKLSNKHLDFFFMEVLGLTKKSSVPDMVNVLIKPAEGIEQVEVKKGTVLNAGKDDEGNELLYKTNEDSVVSNAQVAKLKTVFVEKRTITIEDARVDNIDDSDNGFTKMMELALGDPNPGDTLPKFKSKAANLNLVYADLNNADPDINKRANLYIQEKLYLSIEDFSFILQIHKQDLDTKKRVEQDDWENIYKILDLAHKKKAKAQRISILRDTREKEIDERRGLENLLRFALGSPDPGDRLPLYKGKVATIQDVYNDLKYRGEPLETNQDLVININNDAANYISDELFLAQKDFIRLVLVSQNPDATDNDWFLVYKALELAQRKIRNESLPSPQKGELLNVYAQEDAKASAFGLFGEEENSFRFKTFGTGETNSEHATTPAVLGVGLSTPSLVLNEGHRLITTTIAFDVDVDRQKGLKKLLEPKKDAPRPFLFYLSTLEEWIQPKVKKMSFGDFNIGTPEEVYEGTISGDVISKTKGSGFNELDIGKYFVWSNGTIYEAIAINSTSSIKVLKVGKIAGSHPIAKYSRRSIYLNALQVTLELQEDDNPISAIDPTLPDNFINSEFPSLAIVINNTLVKVGGKKRYVNQYQSLMDLKMSKVHLGVAVTGMRENHLQNNLTNINPKKPFEPFGYQSEIGDSFYLANPEICHKRIDSLDISMEWMNAPEDFKKYYKNYWLIKNDKIDLPESKYKIQSNDDFQAKLSFYDHRAEVPIDNIQLFKNKGGITIEDIPSKISATTKSYKYLGNTHYHTDDEVLNWNRYFHMELIHKDFQHAAYNGLLSKQALSKDNGIKGLTVNPPYTPKLKTVTTGYTAHTEFICEELNTKNDDAVYHIQPFGYNQLKTKRKQGSPYFLPHHSMEGELFIGVDNLLKPQILSLLFQMAEGSANPDVKKPAITWSYLKDNEWHPFDGGSLLSDSTNGLANTGIVKFKIPIDATNNDTLLQDNLSWIKANCNENSSGISDTINILAQAINATFCSEQVSASHFNDLLAPESIKTTLDPIPDIKEVSQPYTSSKGKPAESNALFYNRISERLRHKNRAITMWDYEHMVLEQFPEIYKTKCLPSTLDGKTGQLGKVDVIVIPDIKGKLPFNPFEPKVPADTIFQIQEYLDSRIPAYAEVNVINATYLQVKTRFGVKLKEGYNEGFYKAKLEEELKKFLAPWAYDEGSDITIGGKIYSSVIVNFIAERPYVEYIANIKLFQSKDGVKFTDVRALNDGQNIVKATQPDIILVSAITHEIDVIDEKGYDEDDFNGINYMRVELDFRIGEDLLL